MELFTRQKIARYCLFNNHHLCTVHREVRTKDDTQIVIKLMIFFQLDNIEKMLDK
jgi:hypothetical protein